MNVFKTECFLRISAIFILILALFLVRFATQTKVIIIERKATYRDLDAFVVLVGVDAAAAGYNVLQLVRSFIHSRQKSNFMLISYQSLAWICFLLDQVTVYVVFSTNAAAFTASILAITGSTSFEWMKLCNKYTKFCEKIGTALFFGFIASFLLAVISFISAFNLFRLYSPQRFFRLKAK